MLGNSFVKDRIVFFIKLTILYSVSSFVFSGLKSTMVSRHSIKSFKVVLESLVLVSVTNSISCLFISSFNFANRFLNSRSFAVSLKREFNSNSSRTLIKALRNELGRTFFSSISIIISFSLSIFVKIGAFSSNVLFVLLLTTSNNCSNDSSL